MKKLLAIAGAVALLASCAPIVAQAQTARVTLADYHGGDRDWHDRDHHDRDWHDRDWHDRDRHDRDWHNRGHWVYRWRHGDRIRIWVTF